MIGGELSFDSAEGDGHRRILTFHLARDRVRLISSLSTIPMAIVDYRNRRIQTRQ